MQNHSALRVHLFSHYVGQYVCTVIVLIKQLLNGLSSSVDQIEMLSLDGLF